MNRTPFAPLSAIAIGCLIGFTLVGLAKQDRQALAHCEQRPGATVAECRLVVYGRWADLLRSITVALPLGGLLC